MKKYQEEMPWSSGHDMSIEQMAMSHPDYVPGDIISSTVFCANEKVMLAIGWTEYGFVVEVPADVTMDVAAAEFVRVVKNQLGIKEQ